MMKKVEQIAKIPDAMIKAPGKNVDKNLDPPTAERHNSYIRKNMKGD